MSKELQIEIPGSGPWSGKTVLVSSSDTKRYWAKQQGIASETCPHKISRVVRGEDKHDIKNGNGVVVPCRKEDIPYILLVGQAKVDELRQNMQPNGHAHAPVDTAWVVEMDEQLYFLNKPNNDPAKIAQLAYFFERMRGCPIASWAAIPRLSPDLQSAEYFITRLTVGAIDPKFDSGGLEQMLKANTGYSGGLTYTEVVGTIIKPSSLAHFQVSKIVPDQWRVKTELVGGRFVPQDTSSYSLVNCRENINGLVGASLGIFPKYG